MRWWRILLLTLAFQTISPDHPERVANEMLDIMVTIAQEIDNMSDEFLDAVFENIVDPTRVGCFRRV